MLAPGVPGQLIDDAVVLVEVVASVSENQVRRNRSLEGFKVFFNFNILRGKEAVAKVQDRDRLFLRALQEQVRTADGFLLAASPRAKNDPVELQVAAGAKQFEDRTPATDLDIV